MQCRKCGHQNPSGAKFCSGCGKRLNPEPPNKFLLIGICAAVAVILVAGAFFLGRNSSRQETAQVTITKPATASATELASVKQPSAVKTESSKDTPAKEITTAAECNHRWVARTCGDEIVCSYCGKSMNQYAEHQWEDATYAIAQRCWVCGTMRGHAEGNTISAGFYYTAAVQNIGTVIISNKQVDASGFYNIASVSANSAGGGTYALGLREDGTAVIAFPGRTQKNSNYDYSLLDVSGWKKLVAVEAGDRHAVGLQEDGTVVTTGSNTYGQCDTFQWKKIVAVTAGEKHTVGLRADGTVVAVGCNEDGQCAVTGWTDIIAISAGASYTAGLRSNGTVVVAGSQNNLYTGNWNNIVQISAGAYHLVGLKKDGSVVSTGNDGSNRCNVEDWSDIISVSAGFLHTAGLRVDGVVIVTGESPDDHGLYFKNNDVRISQEAAVISNRQQSLLPVEKNVFSAYANDLIAIQRDGSVLCTDKGIDLSGFRGVVSVAMGDAFALGLRPDGSVVFAQSGKCRYEGFDSMSEWRNIVAIAAGYSHAVGLKADGTVVAAGDNVWGQCDVSGWRDIVTIDASWDYPITLGIQKDGCIVAVGRQNSRAYQDWPAAVDVEHGRAHTVAVMGNGTVAYQGGYGLEPLRKWTDVVSISTSYDTVVGLKADGTVVAAGEDGTGQCSVSSWTDIVAVVVGMEFTAGLKSDGTVVYAGRWDDNLARVVQNIQFP